MSGEEAEASSVDPLEAAFAELDAHWDDPAAHKKVLALGDALERLGDVGKRYRAIRDAHPERAEVAKKQIDALFGLAMTRVARTEKTDAKPTKSRIEWIAFGVSAALIAAALWSMLRSL
jgi:hypothetical protein